nr:MAG TPA: hypothetical protein [Bacteriophage sp.]
MGLREVTKFLYKPCTKSVQWLYRISTRLVRRFSSM